MQTIADITLGQFVLFTLVLVRTSGLVLIAPVFGTPDVPIRVRALLAFALAVLIAPTQWGQAAVWPEGLPMYVTLVGGELFIGFALGLGVVVLLTGVQMAGQMISQVAGLALANVADPTFDDSVSVFSRLLTLLATALFVALGGHRLVMAALLDTFQAVPLGALGMPAGLGELITTLLTESFSLGIRAAAPCVTAVLLATLVLGLVGRTLPQLNILAVGFGFNSMIALAMLGVSLGAVAWAFDDQLEPALQLVIDHLTATVASGA